MGLLTKLLMMIILLSAPQSSKANSKISNLTVVGWPRIHNISNLPEPSWSNEPVLGALVCPALTRLNLVKKKSEPYLLAALKTRKSSYSETIWFLKLRRGLTWWDDSTVTIEDLSYFLERTLEQVLDNRGDRNASFSIRQTSQVSIEVRWKSAPGFGPYILNQFPFYQLKQKKSYLCTGDYLIKPDPQKWILISKKNTRQPRRIEFVDQASSDLRNRASLEFLFAESYQNRISIRSPLRPISCKRTIDFPIFSAIRWNLDSPYASNSMFRKAMTHSLPRGALLRSGAGFLGDLVSGPILRAHPGYNKKVYVRRFDFEIASKMLRKLGYYREDLSDPLKDPSGQALHLTLQKPSAAQPSMIEKVIGDALKRVGVSVHFTNETELSRYDGYLSGVVLSWPNGSLTRLLDNHPKHKEIQELSKLYDQSLTFEFPKFELLKEIHKAFYDIEPFSILMQHRACLTSSSGHKIPRVIIRNPEWFSNLITG